MGLLQLSGRFASEEGFLAKARPYVNHSVAFKGSPSVEERCRKMEEVGLNVFSFPSSMITGCDLLSDSGTTTMTNEQWASLSMGDEAYGSNDGYFELMKQVRVMFGEQYYHDASHGSPNAFLFHQGRAAEDALFTQIGKLGEGLVIPSNGHFDTTEANIRANGIEALNLFSPELKNPLSSSRFRGNMDTDRLRQVLLEKQGKVPLVYVTITNNTGGGQPVSLANVREVSKLAHDAGIPFFLDACRFAENAWFIQQYEPGQKERTILEIVREMFSLADGFTISFKKDGLVNMGGGLFVSDTGLFAKKYPSMLDGLMNAQILKEGHPTYGGMSGRDIMALVVGLKTIVTPEYLSFRISQVQGMAESLVERGLPVLAPAGGHAVYLDMSRFFEGTSLRPHDFGGIAFTALLLGLYGHRACELGHFAFGMFNAETGEETFPEVNFVRFAVPRLRYEEQDLLHTVESVKALHDRRDEIPAVEVVYGKELALRHFKARFRFRA